MLRVSDVVMPIDHDGDALRAAVAAALGIDPSAVRSIAVRRRGYDARGRDVRLVYTLDVAVENEAAALRIGPRARPSPDETHRYPGQILSPPTLRPIVVGSGPCGLFAALALAEMGMSPLLLERGRPVRRRAKDVWGYWRDRRFDPVSNVQFGEGGAGTFSDGKLHSGVKDRGHHGRRVLATLVAAGAPPEIETISKPHVGTLRLVSVVRNLRQRLVALGGEVRFESRVDDFVIDGSGLRGVVVAGDTIRCDRLVLAIGHSARDTFFRLLERGVYAEAKPFSIGVRIEHPQLAIDRARLGRFAGHPLLGAADYKLVHHGERGSAYSFCMCPGGQVVAAASEPDQVVTNGMSHYSRAERNANSGLVVAVGPGELGEAGPWGGVALQRRLEAAAWELGGRNGDAPVQRVEDFLAGRASRALGSVIPSYTPGVRPSDLSPLLPSRVTAALRDALPALDKSLPGFADPDAMLTAIETRTSSPLRFVRGADRQSLSTRGLYPAGEGAGYAGGILSAAIDGIKTAEAIVRDALGLAPEADDDAMRGSDGADWG